MIKRKAFSASSTLGERRQVIVRCSTPTTDRMGDVVVQSGIGLDSYKANPTVLWNHDQNQPRAKCADIALVGGDLVATVQFPPEGDDPDADILYARVRNGVVNAVSIGFVPTDVEPLDPRRPHGGQKILACELLEFSFVAIPANPDAAVVARALATRALPKLSRKGLCHVSWLADLLGSLGYLQTCVDAEAQTEGDGSTVPASMADALRDLGTVLVSMTAEEVAELVTSMGGAPDATDDPTDDDALMMKAARLVTRTAFAHTKAGRVLSSETEQEITQARDLLNKVLGKVDGSGTDNTGKSLSPDLLRAKALAELELRQRHR